MKYKYKKIAAAVFVSIFILGGCAGEPDRLELAKEALSGGRYEEAEEEFGLFIAEQEEMKVKGAEDEERKNINISEAYFGTGIAMFEQERYEEAEAAFRETVKTGGVNTPLLCRLTGICLMEQGKYEEAIGFFAEGVRLPSEEAPEPGGEEEPYKYEESIREMRLLMIDCHEKLRDWKKAEKAAQRYLEEYSDDGAVKREEEFLKTRVKEAENTEEFLKTEQGRTVR